MILTQTPHLEFLSNTLARILTLTLIAIFTRILTLLIPTLTILTLILITILILIFTPIPTLILTWLKATGANTIKATCGGTKTAIILGQDGVGSDKDIPAVTGDRRRSWVDHGEQSACKNVGVTPIELEQATPCCPPLNAYRETEWDFKTLSARPPEAMTHNMLACNRGLWGEPNACESEFKLSILVCNDCSCSEGGMTKLMHVETRHRLVTSLKDNADDDINMACKVYA